MKILIVGSEGFIGTHLYEYYKTKYADFEIYTADILASERQTHFCVDIEKPDFSAIFSRNPFDICINASGLASVPLSVQQPEMDFKANVENVFNLLNSIRLHSPNCKFVQLSSAAVYGNIEVMPISESAPTNPLSPYGFHKYYAEHVCKEFAQVYNLKTAILRIFSAYGEGLKKQFFWDLYQKTLNQTHLEMFGTGNELRDFIYVGDLVRLVDLVVNKASFEGEIYNAANGDSLTIKAAAHILLKIRNFAGTIRFQTKDTKSISHSVADISKIKALGYERVYSFEQGMRNYCEWLTQNEK